MFIDEFDDFVKKQIAYHERKIKVLKDAPAAAMHVVYAETFRRLRAHCIASDELIARQETQLKAPSGAAIPDVSNAQTITPADLAGLPKELLDQLNLPQLDNQEKLIVDLVNEAGSVLSLDKILIGLYRKTGEVLQKRALNQKIFRMIDKGLLWKVPKKKGVYTSIPVVGVNDDSPDDDGTEEK